MKRALGYAGLMLAATTALAGCGGDLGDTEDTDEVGDSVRISEAFVIDIPAGDVWASGLTDQDAARPGLQVRVEVHRFFHRTARWADLNNARREQYQIITTGHESPTGRPRVVATSSTGAFHAMDGAFVRDGELHLLGESTGGAGRGNTRRNPKRVVAGIRFNGGRGTDRITSEANIVPVDDPVNGRVLIDIPAGEGFRCDADQDPGRAGCQAYGWVDQVSFATRWNTGEAFACYNVVTTGAERSDGNSSFLGGSSPDQFRAPEGVFALDGQAFLIGERTGGNRGGNAAAPHRALLFVQFDGRANGNNAVNVSTDVTTLQ